MDYYRNQVTQESWELLVKLSKAYHFILIGGWAVWLYTKQLKSKDIDIILSFEELMLLRSDFDVVKNERLHKYEARKGMVQIDVYTPHYSQIGLPLETVQKYAVSLSGFRVPSPPVLLMLKQVAYAARKGSSKGKKDLLDIVTLLSLPQFDWRQYVSLLSQSSPNTKQQLQQVISSQTEVPELAINRHAYARMKKKWLAMLAL